MEKDYKKQVCNWLLSLSQDELDQVLTDCNKYECDKLIALYKEWQFRDGYFFDESSQPINIGNQQQQNILNNLNNNNNNLLGNCDFDDDDNELLKTYKIKFRCSTEIHNYHYLNIFLPQNTPQQISRIINLVRICDTKTKLDTFTIESGSIKADELIEFLTVLSKRGFLQVPCYLARDTVSKEWRYESPNWFDSKGYFDISEFIVQWFEKLIWQRFWEANKLDPKRNDSSLRSSNNNNSSLNSSGGSKQLPPLMYKFLDTRKNNLKDFWATKTSKENRKRYANSKMANIVQSVIQKLNESHQKVEIDIMEKLNEQMETLKSKLQIQLPPDPSLDQPAPGGVSSTHSVSESPGGLNSITSILSLSLINYPVQFIEFIGFSPLERAGSTIDDVMRKIFKVLQTTYSESLAMDLISSEERLKSDQKNKKLSHTPSSPVRKKAKSKSQSKRKKKSQSSTSSNSANNHSSTKSNKNNDEGKGNSTSDNESDFVQTRPRRHSLPMDIPPSIKNQSLSSMASTTEDEDNSILSEGDDFPSSKNSSSSSITKSTSSTVSSSTQSSSSNGNKKLGVKINTPSTSSTSSSSSSTSKKSKDDSSRKDDVKDESLVFIQTLTEKMEHLSSNQKSSASSTSSTSNSSNSNSLSKHNRSLSKSAEGLSPNLNGTNSTSNNNSSSSSNNNSSSSNQTSNNNSSLYVRTESLSASSSPQKSPMKSEFKINSMTPKKLILDDNNQQNISVNSNPMNPFINIKPSKPPLKTTTINNNAFFQSKINISSDNTPTSTTTTPIATTTTTTTTTTSTTPTTTTNSNLTSSTPSISTTTTNNSNNNGKVFSTKPVMVKSNSTSSIQTSSIPNNNNNNNNNNNLKNNNNNIQQIPAYQDKYKDWRHNKLFNQIQVYKQMNPFVPLQAYLQPWDEPPLPYPHPKFSIKLHQEILDFVSDVGERTYPHVQNCHHVINLIKAVVKRLWPNADLDIYGSFMTGLWLPSSDIDIVVNYGKNMAIKPKNAQFLLEVLEKQIRSDLNHYILTMLCIPSAKIPVIKMVTKDNIAVDISFRENPTSIHTGIAARDLVANNVKEVVGLYPLAIVLKWFLRERGLNNTYTGGLSSYCLVLMLISFLKNNEHCPKKQSPQQPQPQQQQPNNNNNNNDITLSPQPTLKAIPCTCDNGDQISGLNIGCALMRFLEYYGVNFNYQLTGLSIEENRYTFSLKDDPLLGPGLFPNTTGALLNNTNLDPNNQTTQHSIHQLNNTTTPTNIQQQQQHFNNFQTSIYSSTPLVVSDPFVPGKNVASGSFNFSRVKAAFQYAFATLSNTSMNELSFENETILSKILMPNDRL
ncbi:hypothetical protein DLAC_09022 [Tieghemostelium lacteum]|uniref:Poly(A) RNA polymerase mitochondrial-like central palm domain-containing protein n=1 Tax=Tieghemostelium lacteum TaxID=361077 RepID=A0A151Z971_TIELA|nr:hypothetical protein DLAC_09022 [Tieghemostelium lacteum]|eukprot:KYQ90404.1 hypothetical protein DLAC_09022 [Tieghemostelium lacteum]